MFSSVYSQLFSEGVDVSWLRKLLPSKVTYHTKTEQKRVPEGVWTQCPSCSSALYRAELERNCFVCPKCAHHHRIAARQRLTWLFDPDTEEELAQDVEPVDHLKFKDSKKYKDRIVAAQKKTGERAALIAMKGAIKGLDSVAVAFEFGFIGGSMGTAVGERFVQGVERSLLDRVPFICFSTSGGARMQEGLRSLFQMSKTSAALAKLSESGIPYISVLTDPTTGGVSASFAMLGDIIIAEPGALIGFAGPRVIQQTVREVLPEGFQRSEFLLENGAIDMIVDRRQMRDKLYGLLAKLCHQAA